MLGLHGVQSGIQRSVTERRLFDALFRLSRVGLKKRPYTHSTLGIATNCLADNRNCIIASHRRLHASTRLRSDNQDGLTPEERETKRRAQASEESRKRLLQLSSRDSKPKGGIKAKKNKGFDGVKDQEPDLWASSQPPNGRVRADEDDLERQLAQLAARRRDTLRQAEDTIVAQCAVERGNKYLSDQHTCAVEERGAGIEIADTYGDRDTEDLEQSLPEESQIERSESQRFISYQDVQRTTKRRTSHGQDPEWRSRTPAPRFGDDLSQPRTNYLDSQQRMGTPQIAKKEQALWDSIRLEEKDELKGPSGGRNSITDIKQALGPLVMNVQHPSIPKWPEASPEMSTQIRSIMRQIPAHVVALTTAIPNNKRSGVADPYRGMVMSSFNTVSLDPVPIISFNIKMPSHTLDALKMSRQFFIHFLAANSVGKSIAEDLSKPQECQTAFKGGLGAKVPISPFDVKYECKDGSEGKVTLPLLLCAGLFGSVLRCSLWDSRVSHGYTIVNDHVLVRGIVLEVLDPVKLSAGTSYDEHSRRTPLMYSSGVYRSPSHKPIRPITSQGSPKPSARPLIATGFKTAREHKPRTQQRKVEGQSKGVGGWLRELFSP